MAKRKIFECNRKGEFDNTWWRTAELSYIQLWEGCSSVERYLDQDDADEQMLNMV